MCGGAIQSIKFRRAQSVMIFLKKWPNGGEIGLLVTAGYGNIQLYAPIHCAAQNSSDAARILRRLLNSQI